MKNVFIVNMDDTGNEAEALRQVLERMNYFVCMKNIGRPNDLIDVFQGKYFDFDYLIISCHGIDGNIAMPILGENVYFDNEPRGNFSANEISKYLKITNKVVLNLGCTTGLEKTAKVFSAKNTYIAPKDYILGNSGLFFAIQLFYELTKGKDIKSAFKIAAQCDDETSLFTMYQNSKKIN